ncbi:MAG: hypothetical protein KDD36_00965 [Flavobacteriales bacterium]|nr:hypothetical protein [Flavobacteriales bacterium]
MKQYPPLQIATAVGLVLIASLLIQMAMDISPVYSSTILKAFSMNFLIFFIDHDQKPKLTKSMSTLAFDT